MRKILVIYTDGGSRGNPGPSAYAFLTYLNGELVYKESEFLGLKTNNFAEYSGVLSALNWLNLNKEKLFFDQIIFYLDSELVVRQLTGEYRIKNKTLKEFVLQIKKIEKVIGKKIDFISIPREKNKQADFLLNKTLDENV